MLTAPGQERPDASLARRAGPEASEQFALISSSSRTPEFAIAIADEFQRKGLGTRLMKLIVAHASRTGVRRLFGEILAENQTMLEFVRRLGFGVGANAADHRTMIACISVAAMTSTVVS